MLDNVVLYREQVKPTDVRDVRMITSSTASFAEVDLDVAAELVGDRLALGDESGYHFVFAERSGKAIGFVCYGPIPATKDSFEVFWISVMDSFRGMGIGRRLMEIAEDKSKAMGGKRLWVETSSRGPFDKTREFYASCDYRKEAVLKNYFGENDSKVLFVKELK
jgi:ribosomal protein S18 acetylase RimI-like enzyme